MASAALSDRGIAVFTFAAYHQLSSGEKVVDVVLHDGAGHSADPAGVEEITMAGLARVEGDRVVFTDNGRVRLGRVIDAIRTA